MKWLAAGILVVAFVLVWPLMSIKRGWIAAGVLVAAGVAAYIINGFKFY